MLSFSIAVAAISRFALLSFSCAEFKQAGRGIGHGTRDVTREIGHGSCDAFNEFKKDIKAATD